MENIIMNIGVIIENPWIQAAVALFPAMLTAFILLFARKLMKKFAFLLLSLVVSSAFLFCSVKGVLQLVSASGNDDAVVRTASLPACDDFENAVYAFLLVGDYESASNLVTEYADAYGYDDLCSLMTARISVCREYYRAALGIYRKLYGSDLCEEALAVEKIVTYGNADTVLAAELAAAGQPTLISEPETAEAESLLDGGMRVLMEHIFSDEYSSDKFIDGAKWIIEANELYDRYAASGIRDESAAEALYDRLEELPQRKILRRFTVFREAQLKLNLLRGGFDDIVSALDDNACYIEYMAALDLYLNGKVEKRPLMRAFGVEQIEGLNEVISALRKLRKTQGGDLDHADRLVLDTQIERLEAYKSNEVLYYIENKLADAAEDYRNYEEVSKIYMSLAKLSGEGGSDVDRNRYFSDALVTSPVSKDGEYSDAMNRLAATISDNDNLEDVRAIPQYAEQAVRNSYILKGIGEIVYSPEKEAEQISAFEDYTIKAGAAVTINGIDTSNFNEVVVKVQLSDEFLTERELINLVRLNDCNYNISNYTIEKMEFEKANIILCCDNSGSMSGSIGSLRNAVSKFIESSNENESLGFYTFDNNVIQSLPVGTATPEALQKAIASMGAFGGTNIFGTLKNILDEAPVEMSANQIIILMTDGQDSFRHSTEEINSVIGSSALNSGYIVYVLGMGSGVDTTYLTSIAAATGGQFIYSPSDSQLDSLYTFIHGALKNQYKITFQAEDTLTVSDRKLTVELDERNVSDTRYYSIAASDEELSGTVFDRGVAVFGLRTRLIYKKKNVTDVDISGKGFKASDSMTVVLRGSRTYTLRAAFIDTNTFRISVPADIAMGIYDAEIFLNNRRALFLKELTVADGEPDEVIFGNYRFSAFDIDTYSDHIVLSGFVTMNDWLHFVGSITLTGTLDDASMTLTDHSGVYIDYSDAEAATGYAKMLRERGIPQYLPSIGTLKIYNAVASNSDYPTEPHTMPLLQFANLFNFYYPIMRLYPDRIMLEIEDGDTRLPLQDFFLSSTSKSSLPFDVAFLCQGTLSAQNISISGNVKVKADKGQETALVKLLDTKASIQKDVGVFEFDTLKNEYSFDLNVNISALVLDTYVGFGLAWKDLTLNTVRLYVDHDCTVNISGVPITFSDFMLGVDGISETLPDATYEEVSALSVIGSMQIDACKVSAVVPKLENYVGDASLLSIPDAEFRLRFNHFSIEASASLELINCFTLGNATVKLGNFEYSNALLGLEDTSVRGVYIALTTGLSWDRHNIRAELTGKGEGTINSRFIGVSYQGTASLGLNWWIFEKSLYVDGQALIGFYKDHSDNLQFVIRTSQVENGKRRGAIFYITSKGKMDYDFNYKD